MRTLKVSSFEDLMQGHDQARIKCLMSGVVVRTLTLIDLIEAGLTKVVKIEFPGGLPNAEHIVPLDTKIVYEPWAMDRGSLLFGDNKQFKICTEGDIVHFPGDSHCFWPRTMSIVPGDVTVRPQTDRVRVANNESANLDLGDMQVQAHVGRSGFDAVAQVLGQEHDANIHALVLEGLIDGDPHDDLGQVLQPVVDFLRKIR